LIAIGDIRLAVDVAGVARRSEIGKEGGEIKTIETAAPWDNGRK
jgi:hypothetical protein